MLVTVVGSGGVIEEVSRNIAGVSEMSQNNASQVRQGRDMAEQLQNLAQHLDVLTGHFKVWAE